MGQQTFRGYVMGEVRSSLQKAIRRSDEFGAVWWAVELDQSGFGSYLWRTLATIVSEDIGPAWPEGPAVVQALAAQYDRAARFEPSSGGRLQVVQAVMMMARAGKTRRVDVIYGGYFGARERLFEPGDEPQVSEVMAHESDEMAEWLGESPFVEHLADAQVNRSGRRGNPPTRPTTTAARLFALPESEQ
jgi:replication-associated recombination protein RarA